MSFFKKRNKNLPKKKYVVPRNSSLYPPKPAVQDLDVGHLGGDNGISGKIYSYEELQRKMSELETKEPVKITKIIEHRIELAAKRLSTTKGRYAVGGLVALCVFGGACMSMSERQRPF